MASQKPMDNQTTNAEELVTLSNCVDVISKFISVPFMSENPVLWFRIADSIFAESGVTEDKIKFRYAICVINPDSICFVEDIVNNPPEENQYEILKNVLIKRLTELNKQLIAKLMDGETMGNRIPSEFLQVLQKLTGISRHFNPQIRDFIIEQWKIRLPTCIQAMLNCFKTATEDELVMAADALYEINQEKQESIRIRDAVQDLKADIDELSEKFRQLNHARSRSKSRLQSATRKFEYYSTKFCWYHQNFGASSSKCKKPCVWTMDTRK